MIDALTSTSKTAALSANQGRLLKQMIDAIPTQSGGSGGTVTSKADAPAAGYDLFIYDVDCGLEDRADRLQSTNVQGAVDVSTDVSLIKFPGTYTAAGMPTRLVIYNHGASSSLPAVNMTEYAEKYTNALISAGYAVLFVNGLPVKFRDKRYASYDGLCFGGPLYLRSAIAAYNYVTGKYNIATDGCFVVGQSMGGLATVNLVNAGVLPIKAIAVDAPVLDLYNDAYKSGGWASGTLAGGTATAIAWAFQFDGFDWANGKYTTDGSTYKAVSNINAGENADATAIWQANQEKIAGYNPFETGKFMTDSSHYGIKLPCPVMVWHGETDGTNQISISRAWVDMLRRGGTIAYMRTVKTNVHCVWRTADEYSMEMANWLNRWQ